MEHFHLQVKKEVFMSGGMNDKRCVTVLGKVPLQARTSEESCHGQQQG